jgi:hypothetical protein
MASDTNLMPVFWQHGCAGHLMRSPKGFRAFDCNDKLIGIFATSDAAAQALLNQQDRKEFD